MAKTKLAESCKTPSTLTNHAHIGSKVDYESRYRKEWALDRALGLVRDNCLPGSNIPIGNIIATATVFERFLNGEEPFPKDKVEGS